MSTVARHNARRRSLFLRHGARARKARRGRGAIGLTPNRLRSSASACASSRPARAAIGLDPAASAQKPGRARILRELQVLVGRGEQERGHDFASRCLPRLRRGSEIAPDRRRDRRQRVVAQMGARIAVDGRPRDVAWRPREQIREARLRSARCRCCQSSSPPPPRADDRRARRSGHGHAARAPPRRRQFQHPAR